jgi:hypothetical protein
MTAEKTGKDGTNKSGDRVNILIYDAKRDKRIKAVNKVITELEVIAANTRSKQDKMVVREACKDYLNKLKVK